MAIRLPDANALGPSPSLRPDGRMPAGPSLIGANALAAAGAEFDKMGAIVEKRQNDENAYQSEMKLLGLGEKWNKEFNDRKTAAESGAPGFAAKTLDDFDAEAREVYATVPTDRKARQQFVTAYQRMRGKLGGMAEDFERTEGTRHELSLMDKAFQQEAKGIMDNPQGQASVVDRWDKLIDLNPRLDAAKKDIAKKNVRAGVVDAALSSALIEKDPEAIRSIIAEHRDHLTPAKYAEAMKVLEIGRRKEAITYAATGQRAPGYTGGSRLSPDDVSAINDAAKRLKVSPEDLAAAIHFETGGKMSAGTPGQGPAAGRFGLIQFGPAEAKEYGAHPGQSFPEQMQAVERYLKARGLPEGADLTTIYKTINGGNPRVSSEFRDGSGRTIAEHVGRIEAGSRPAARAFLAARPQPPAETMSGEGEPLDPTLAEVNRSTGMGATTAAPRAPGAPRSWEEIDAAVQRRAAEGGLDYYETQQARAKAQSDWNAAERVRKEREAQALVPYYEAAITGRAANLRDLMNTLTPAQQSALTPEMADKLTTFMDHRLKQSYDEETVARLRDMAADPDNGAKFLSVNLKEIRHVLGDKYEEFQRKQSEIRNRRPRGVEGAMTPLQLEEALSLVGVIKPTGNADAGRHPGDLAKYNRAWESLDQAIRAREEELKVEKLPYTEALKVRDQWAKEHVIGQARAWYGLKADTAKRALDVDLKAIPPADVDAIRRELATAGMNPNNEYSIKRAWLIAQAKTDAALARAAAGGGPSGETGGAAPSAPAITGAPGPYDPSAELGVTWPGAR